MPLPTATEKEAAWKAYFVVQLGDCSSMLGGYSGSQYATAVPQADWDALAAKLVDVDYTLTLTTTDVNVQLQVDALDAVRVVLNGFITSWVGVANQSAIDSITTISAALLTLRNEITPYLP